MNLSNEKNEELKASDESDNIIGEVSKRLKMDHQPLVTEMEQDTGVMDEETLSKSEIAWRLILF